MSFGRKCGRCFAHLQSLMTLSVFTVIRRRCYRRRRRRCRRRRRRRRRRRVNKGSGGAGNHFGK